jgi:hypothetical protein
VIKSHIVPHPATASCLRFVTSVCNETMASPPRETRQKARVESKAPLLVPKVIHVLNQVYPFAVQVPNMINKLLSSRCHVTFSKNQINNGNL